MGDNGDVYLMTDYAGGMIVELGDPPTAVPLALGSTSDIEFDNVGFSNELAAHVFEIKTVDPVRTRSRVVATRT